MHTTVHRAPACGYRRELQGGKAASTARRARHRGRRGLHWVMVPCCFHAPEGGTPGVSGPAAGVLSPAVQEGAPPHGDEVERARSRHRPFCTGCTVPGCPAPHSTALAGPPPTKSGAAVGGLRSRQAWSCAPGHASSKSAAGAPRAPRPQPGSEDSASSRDSHDHKACGRATCATTPTPASLRAKAARSCKTVARELARELAWSSSITSWARSSLHGAISRGGDGSGNGDWRIEWPSLGPTPYCTAQRRCCATLRGLPSAP